jgi:hypothetical protein
VDGARAIECVPRARAHAGGEVARYSPVLKLTY